MFSLVSYSGTEKGINFAQAEKLNQNFAATSVLFIGFFYDF